MKRSRRFPALSWLSTILIVAAIGMAVFQLISFSRLHSFYPTGMEIAGVPVSGLDRQEAALRLLEIYTLPVELYYDENPIHLDPSIVGFELDLESMLAVADLERTKQPYWAAFWDYLLGNTVNPTTVPLRATYSEARLRTFLNEEISSRYDMPPSPALPIVGTVNFQAGTLGTELDIEQAIIPIESALRSIDQRFAILNLRKTLPPRPSLQNLEVLLKQTIVDIAEFNGTAGLYFLDLQSGQEIHFGFHQGVEVSTNPDIAFTTASIIKIPILVSVFRRLENTFDSETVNLIEKMILESGNESADWLMERVIHPYRSPLMVTEDLQSLGLENTFLAGHFYQGAPLLLRYETPANQREDVSTDPDPYNQTTSSDMGMLLADLYHCAQTGGGALSAVFQGEITQAECQTIVNYLTRNQIAVLLEAGIPEGTVAHKHGWVTSDGVINLIGDAGLIFTPGGNFVLVIFLYDPVQLIWDPSSELVTKLTNAVYNFYNLPTP